jgi:hypothetical protein
MSGRAGGRIAASAACTQRPSIDARPSRMSRTSSSNASSVRPSRWSSGYPNASYSGSCQPAPTPSVNRPPEISSVVAAILASSAGFRNRSPSTSVPMGMVEVAAARAASTLHASWAPRSGSPGNRNTVWSGTHNPSRPSVSARRANARASRQGWGQPAWLPTGTMTPTFTSSPSAPSPDASGSASIDPGLEGRMWPRPRSGDPESLTRGDLLHSRDGRSDLTVGYGPVPPG